MMAATQRPALRGILKHHEPLARHTTWRVGGPAQIFYQPADSDDLAEFIQQLPAALPVMWLGLGSNVLVRDGGIAAAVINTSNRLANIAQLDETTVRAEAGVPCAKVARFCTRLGLVGVEFLAGIPGTLGGALAMNAGAFGGETWNAVIKVETLDRQGQRHERVPGEYHIAYRHVEGPPQEWFVAAHLRLQQGDAEASMARIKALLEKRNLSQPTNQPSCGSVFRNPPGDYAARLIEASGLKGVCIGGACVSSKHANFIVNTGNATAAEIEALMQLVAQQVYDSQGVRLIPEVHIVGDK